MFEEYKRHFFFSVKCVTIESFTLWSCKTAAKKCSKKSAARANFVVVVVVVVVAN